MSDDLTSPPKFRRVLLKLSGEAFADPQQGFGIDPRIVASIARQVAEAQNMGTELGVTVGGGNIIRGLSASAQGTDRTTADYMGMLATVINALALQDALEKEGVQTRVHTRDLDAGARRALHPSPRDPPPRERARRDLCRGDRQPLLLDRYDGRSARARDRRGRDPQGDTRRRRLRFGPAGEL